VQDVGEEPQELHVMVPDFSFVVEHLGKKYLVSLDVDYWEDDQWWVARIYVPRDIRRMGYATVVFLTLCDSADYHQKSIYLHSAPYGPDTAPAHKLERLYESLGFVFDGHGLAVRHPRCKANE